ncbi:MAG: YtxH domain-containing protein [Vicinamibacterales bacterium]
MNNDRNLMILGGMIGAIVGVGVGFALFTERGRRLRAELQPEIETVIREAMRLTQVVEDFKSGRAVGPVEAAGGAAAWPRRTS